MGKVKDVFYEKLQEVELREKDQQIKALSEIVALQTRSIMILEDAIEKEIIIQEEIAREWGGPLETPKQGVAVELKDALRKVQERQ